MKKLIRTKTPQQTFTAANKSFNSSFIRTSFFYCEAKEEKKSKSVQIFLDKILRKKF
jgi:hypothetical protein